MLLLFIKLGELLWRTLEWPMSCSLCLLIEMTMIISIVRARMKKLEYFTSRQKKYGINNPNSVCLNKLNNFLIFFEYLIIRQIFWPVVYHRADLKIYLTVKKPCSFTLYANSRLHLKKCKKCDFTNLHNLKTFFEKS